MEKKKSSTPGYVAVFLVIIAFLLSWFWIVPQYKQNKADVAQVDHELTAVKAKLASLKSAKSTLDSLGSTVDSMFVAVPSGQDNGDIITTLEAIATANKTYIPSFQISGGSESSGTTSQLQSTSAGAVSVSFSVSGDFAGLTGFIKSIENNLKFFAIKSATIAPADDGTFSKTLQLETYTQGNTSTISSGASADVTSATTAQ